MSVDLRPRVVFYTQSGAVVVVIDPASAFGGQVLLPGAGAVPYDIDWIGQRMILHIPAYGDVPISLTGGGGSTVSIPGIGTVPVEVIFGEPDIPFEQRATATQAFFGSTLSTMVPIIVVGLVGLLIWQGRRG